MQEKNKIITFFLSTFFLPNGLKGDRAPKDLPYVLRETQKKPHLTCESFQRPTPVASRRPGSPDICCVGHCLIYLQGKQGRSGRESTEPLSQYSSPFILHMPSFEIWDIHWTILMADNPLTVDSLLKLSFLSSVWLNVSLISHFHHYKNAILCQCK